MKHPLPDLPYSRHSLEPWMSAETLEYHHDRHQGGYVKKLNELIPGTEFENMALEEIITNSSSGPIFNNAAQVWNHTFFWHCMTPERGTQPSENLRTAIERDFGSVDNFNEQFKKAGVSHFGSGYAWLIRKDADGKLEIESTPNAVNPLRAGVKPLLTCDLWEHAYYIDYRNERNRFLDGFRSILNWDFVSRNFETPWEMAA